MGNRLLDLACNENKNKGELTSVLTEMKWKYFQHSSGNDSGDNSYGYMHPRY